METYGNLRELYRELFEQAGYHVSLIPGEHDVEEAMDVKPDVVVIDPAEWTGVQHEGVKIESGCEGCPLVVVNSGKISEESSGGLDNADVHLLKSPDTDSLVEAVQAALLFRLRDINIDLRKEG